MWTHILFELQTFSHVNISLAISRRSTVFPWKCATLVGNTRNITRNCRFPPHIKRFIRHKVKLTKRLPCLLKDFVKKKKTLHQPNILDFSHFAKNSPCIHRLSFYKRNRIVYHLLFPSFLCVHRRITFYLLNKGM